MAEGPAAVDHSAGQTLSRFLPKQTYPIRTGVHPNTAFGLGFALDDAVTVGDAALKDLVVARSRDYEGEHCLASFAVFLLTETP